MRVTIFNKIRLLTLTLFAFFYLHANFTRVIYAQGGAITGVRCPSGQVFIAILDNCFSFSQTIEAVVTWALILGTLFALIKLAIGAVSFIVSSGDPTKLETARETITDALLGLVMILSAWVLLSYASTTFPERWQIHFFKLPFVIGGPTS